MRIRLIIAGSRTVDPSDDEIEAAAVEMVCEAFRIDECDPDDVARVRAALPDYIEEVICGKADGADAAGARWARSRGIAVHEDPVTDQDRRAHGPYLAPKMRNRRMAERGTHALIFWDGRSGGSADMACRMVAREKPVRVIPTRRRARRRRRAG